MICVCVCFYILLRKLLFVYIYIYMLTNDLKPEIKTNGLKKRFVYNISDALGKTPLFCALIILSVKQRDKLTFSLWLNVYIYMRKELEYETY